MNIDNSCVILHYEAGTMRPKYRNNLTLKIVGKHHCQIAWQWNVIVMNWFIGSFRTGHNWVKDQISIQYSRFFVQKFYVNFQVQSLFHTCYKLFKHHSSKYPPKMSVFHLEFDYYLSWTFNLSSHFLKPLKAIKANFLLLSALQHVFTSTKYHLYIGKKKKKQHCQDSYTVKHIAWRGCGVLSWATCSGWPYFE